MLSFLVYTQRSSGVGRESGNPYSICEITVLEPMPEFRRETPTSGGKGKIERSGFSIAVYRVQDEMYIQAKTLLGESEEPLPIDLEVETFRDGDQSISNVTSIRSV